MKSMMKRGLLTAAIVLGVPAIAVAQAPAALPNQQEVEGWLMELNDLHQQLEDIQRQALQDPALFAAQEELGEEIRMAMEQRDPSMAQRMARVESLESEAIGAQQSGDTQKLQELMAEAQQIQEHFMSVQQSVLDQPAIASKVDDFQVQLERKMLDVDPGSAGLITRFRELETKLQTAMRGGA